MIKDRLEELMTVLKLSKRSFCFSIGKSEAFFRNTGKAIGSDVIGNILRSYPNVNPRWLILGEGTIFLDGTNKYSINETINVVSAPEEEYQTLSDIDKYVKELEDRVAEQKEVIKQMNDIINGFKTGKIFIANNKK